MPYQDKPRLYLNRDEFDGEDDNAFMMFEDGSIEGRFGGETHRLSVNGAVEYAAPGVSATLDRDTFAVASASVDGADDVSLQPAAVMYTVLQGVGGSMRHIPTMSVAGGGGTFIPDPGFSVPS